MANAKKELKQSAAMYLEALVNALKANKERVDELTAGNVEYVDLNLVLADIRVRSGEIYTAYLDCKNFYELSGISKRTHKKHALAALREEGMQIEFILFMSSVQLVPFWL